jgi:hypothetical protein
LLTFGGRTELVALSASLGGVPLDDGPITAAGGVINLVWPNGTSESLRFQRQAGMIRITLVPEPNTFALSLFPIAFWLTRRR